jgi:DNA-binding transcriptional LysR family regulator
MVGKVEKFQQETLHRLAVGSGLTVRALETFVAVARFGTMSAAAEHLGMTQSAVSQLIVQIEGALDVQLFDRKVRPPALTLQGAALLEPARTIVNGVGQFQSAMRWGAATRMPLLRIGMMNSFAETAGPAVLVRLRAVAEQLVVDTGFGATRARAVADRETDLIITTDEAPPPPGIQAVPLLTEPLLIVAPQSYQGDLKSLSALGRTLDLIRFGRDPFMNSRFDLSLRSWGIEPTHAYQMDTHAAVLEMVAAGVGWTILPPLAVYRAMARSEAIKVAPVPAPVISRSISLISRIGEGAVLLEDIHETATKALRAGYMKSIQSLMPGVKDLVTLHDMAAVAA